MDKGTSHLMIQKKKKTASVGKLLGFKGIKSFMMF